MLEEWLQNAIALVRTTFIIQFITI